MIKSLTKMALKDWQQLSITGNERLRYRNKKNPSKEIIITRMYGGDYYELMVTGDRTDNFDTFAEAERQAKRYMKKNKFEYY